MTGHPAPHTRLGAGREFAAVRAMLARWGDVAVGVGDDCAVLDVPAGERLCVSTDSSVEGVHFRRDWLTPEEIGYRAATAALSDLAAMAASPLGLLLAVTVPPTWTEALPALADGVGEAARAAGAPVLGGDTTAGERLSLTVTVLGSATRPVARRGARPGDRVYVTGRLGGPRRALAALYAGAAPAAADRERLARPRARILEARWLAERGATAMIDVSDGLGAELGHLAAAGAVRIVLDVARVPAVAGGEVEDALAGGEEYELAVAAPQALDAAAFHAAFGVELTEIGGVEDGAPEVVLVRDGARVDLPAGYDHFSR